MLQETVPQKADRFLTPGFSASIAYGFTNSLSLQAKGWMGLQEVESNSTRFGLSLSGLIYLNDSAKSIRAALIPCFGMTFDDNNFGDGKGVGIWFAAWFPTETNFKPYCAIGTAFGWEDLEGPIEDFGLGIFLNPGLTVESGKYIEWNLELSSSLIFNRYENSTYFVFAPSIGIGIKF